MSSTYAGDPTNFPASITIPSGGDLVRAASVNPALEGLADRTAALAKRRLMAIVTAYGDDPSLAHAQIGADMVNPGGGPWTNGVELADFTGLQADDIVEVVTSFNMKSSANGGAALRLGNTAAGPGFAAHGNQPEQHVSEWSSPTSVTITAWFKVSSTWLGGGGSLALFLQHQGEPLTLQMQAGWSLVARVYRGA